MGAAVAGLAVAAAGLLSQVPVLGEVFAGLNAVIDAVAFQMDKVLRPVLTPLTNFFFGLAESIFEADGAMGTVVGVIGSIITAIGGLIALAAPFVALAGKIFGFATVWATVKSVVVGAVGTIVSVIGGIPAALAAAVIALAAFVVGYLTNWKGMRDKTNQVVSSIVNFVVDGFKWLVENGLSFLSDLVNRGVGFFNTLADNLATWAEDVASDAVDWGKGIIDGLVSGLKNAITSGGSKIKELLGLDDISTSGVSSSAFNFDSISTGNLDTSVSQGDDFIGSVGSGETTIMLDGREINKGVGRIRKDTLNRRG
jgi:phage-related protein